MKNNKQKTSLSVAWYKPGQWSKLRAISADSDQLEETYGEWQIIAENALQDFAAQSIFPEKAMVDVNDLLAWCNDRGLPVNGESRSQYVAWLQQEKNNQNI